MRKRGDLRALQCFQGFQSRQEFSQTETFARTVWLGIGPHMRTTAFSWHLLGWLSFWVFVLKGGYLHRTQRHEMMPEDNTQSEGGRTDAFLKDLVRAN